MSKIIRNIKLGGDSPVVINYKIRSYDNVVTPITKTLHNMEDVQMYSGDNFGGDDEDDVQTPKTAAPLTEEEKQNKLDRDLDTIRKHYEENGKTYLIETQLQADKDALVITNKARAEAANIIAAAKEEAQNVYEQSFEEGRKAGFPVGEKEGMDSGYKQGLLKCANQMQSLKALCDNFEAEKQALFDSYQKDIFDLALTIANKITIDNIKQREKTALQKMIKQASKDFRNAKTVKISVSSLDISDEAEISADLLQEYFVNSQNIDFEILHDAPEGTLIVDGGGEIIDASVSTQLKMIEELGSGKYRDASTDDIQDENANDDETSVEKPSTTRKHRSIPLGRIKT